jgi:PhzF family phenazine biosynthesis protein
MTQKIYIVDAFADRLFTGNPAAVCPLETWLDDALMQSIALENNLSETVFFVEKDNGHFHIRWFTPKVEVALCGHATLASAHVLFEHLGYAHEQIVFDSLSGELHVRRENGKYFLNFPADMPRSVDFADLDGLWQDVASLVFKGKTDYMFVFDNEEAVRSLQPDFRRLAQLHARGIIVTAASQRSGLDFVSRFFGPQSGIDEDPVTGSAHTLLIPYWALQLGKNELEAAQVSARGGRLSCRLLNERVEIGGKAVTYLIGEVFV